MQFLLFAFAIISSIIASCSILRRRTGFSSLLNIKKFEGFCKIPLLIILFFLSGKVATANNYYFSDKNGNDSYSSAQAQNPLTPWKSLAKLNSFFSNIRPGDSILLNRGDVFRGSVISNTSGTASSPITISAYGTGDAPVITLPSITGWQRNSNGVYSIKKQMWPDLSIFYEDGKPLLTRASSSDCTDGKWWCDYRNVYYKPTSGLAEEHSVTVANIIPVSPGDYEPAINLSNSSYITIDGLEVDAYGIGVRTFDDKLSTVGLTVQNSVFNYCQRAILLMPNIGTNTNTTIKNCLFYRNQVAVNIYSALSAGGSGQTQGTNIGCKITDNEMSENGTTDGTTVWPSRYGTDYEAIGVQNFMNGTIANNYVHGGFQIGIIFYNIETKSSDNNIVSNNRILNNKKGGLILQGDNCTEGESANYSFNNNFISNNLFVNSVADFDGTIVIYPGKNTSQMNYFVNNTLSGDANVIYFPTSRSPYFTIENNIVYNSGNYRFVAWRWSGKPANFVMDYNLYFEDNGKRSYGFATTRGLSLLDMQNLGLEVHSKAVNPLFANVNSNDYQLQPKSPGIDSGVNVGLPFTGKAPDIGAFETGKEEAPITPDAPVLLADDALNTLSASHTLGDSVILVCENGAPYLPYSGPINVGNLERPAGYWRFKVRAAPQRNESAVQNSPVFTITTTPDAPVLSADDALNTLSASHTLGDSVILVCENGAPYLPYSGPINVGNAARPAGYWKFKVKAAQQRNESAVQNSPVFTITTTPDAPVLSADDALNTLSASHPLGDSVILVCENGAPYLPYTGPINVGNVERPAGYWKFKVRAAPQRNESAVQNSPVFTITTTPDAPVLSANDALNTLSASHPLGDSVILVCENGAPYLPYSGPINVGNVDRPAGYWKFKVKAAQQRNESAVQNSPVFTITTTPDAPVLSADDALNTLSASHPLGDSVILVCENGAPYLPYTGPINVGNVERPAGYWKFKVRAAPQRNESAVQNSPVFTITTTPDAPVLSANDALNTLSASHPLGDSVILVCENGAPYLPYTGPINVGNVERPAGYWKFKVKAAPQRNESAVENSPVFTVSTNRQANIFRSKNTGKWKDINSWEFSSDSIVWNVATRVPVNTDNTVTIQQGDTVTIDNTVTIDELRIEDGGVLQVAPKGVIIANNGTGDDIYIAPLGAMIVQSDSTGTGIIGNSSGTIAGAVTVERYIPAKRAWCLLTAPVTANTKQTINEAWQEGATSSEVNPHPGYGTHITGGTAANGFDQSLTNSSSIKYYDKALINLSNTKVTTVGQYNGYFIYVRGSRSYDLAGTPVSTVVSATTLRVKGELNQGAKTLTFNNPAGNQFFLAGNPYAAPVDFATIGKVNLKNTFWAWDSRRKGTSSGGYVTVSWDDIEGDYDIDYSASQTAQTRIIQSGQAMLVQAQEAGMNATVTFNETDKTIISNTSNVFRGSSTDPIQQLRISLSRNTGSEYVAVDGVLAKFGKGYSSGTEDDAAKLNNYDETLSLKRNRLKLSIERRPLIVQDDTLFLNIDALKTNSQYSFEFDAGNFENQSCVAFLVDKFLGIQTPLSLTTNTLINFTVEGKPASADTSRFIIIFRPSSTLPLTFTGMKAWQANQGVQVQWNVQSETGVQQYIVEKSADMRQFTTVSATPAYNNNIAETYNSTDLMPFKGDNFYRIKIVQKSSEIKYSNVVKVRLEKGQLSFKIYSNPVKNNKATMQLVNVPKGEYSLVVYDQNGGQVLNKNIHHDGAILMSRQILLPPTTASGTYNVVFKGVGNNALTLQQTIIVL